MIAEAICIAAGASYAQGADPIGPALDDRAPLQRTPLDNVPYQALGILATDPIKSDWPNPTPQHPQGGGTYNVLGWLGQSNQFHMAAWCPIVNFEGEILYTIPDFVINLQHSTNNGIQFVPGITLPGSVQTNSVWPTDPSGAWPASTVLTSGGVHTPSSPGWQDPVFIGEGTIPNPDPSAPSCDYKFSYFSVLGSGPIKSSCPDAE